MKFSTITLIFAQLFNTASKLAIFIALMQFGGSSTAGSYTLALAVVTPVFLLFAFSLREIYVTSPVSYYFHSFLTLRISAGIVGVLVVSAIAGIFYSGTALLITVMGIYRFCEMLVDIRIAHFQRAGRITLMSLSTFTLSLVSSLSLVICFWITKSLTWSILAATVASLLVFLASLLIRVEATASNLVRQDHESQAEIRSLSEAFHIYKNGLMLSISAFAVSFGTNMPVLLLGAFHSEATVGIYSSIYNLMSVTTILFSSVTQVELRSFANFARRKQFSQLRARARKVSAFLTVVAILGGIVIVSAGDIILGVVFGQDFSDQRLPLLVMAATIALAPAGFIMDAQLTALHKFFTQGVLSVITLTLTIAISFLLVPPYAILGGTLTVFLTMLIRNLAKHYILTRALIRLNPPHETQN